VRKRERGKLKRMRVKKINQFYAIITSFANNFWPWIKKKSDKKNHH
jgi:hypothetical protein